MSTLYFCDFWGLVQIVYSFPVCPPGFCPCGTRRGPGRQKVGRGDSLWWFVGDIIVMTCSPGNSGSPSSSFPWSSLTSVPWDLSLWPGQGASLAEAAQRATLLGLTGHESGWGFNLGCYWVPEDFGKSRCPDHRDPELDSGMSALPVRTLQPTEPALCSPGWDRQLGQSLMIQVSAVWATTKGPVGSFPGPVLCPWIPAWLDLWVTKPRLKRWKFVSGSANITIPGASRSIHPSHPSGRCQSQWAMQRGICWAQARPPGYEVAASPPHCWFQARCKLFWERNVSLMHPGWKGGPSRHSDPGCSSVPLGAWPSSPPTALPSHPYSFKWCTDKGGPGCLVDYYLCEDLWLKSICTFTFYLTLSPGPLPSLRVSGNWASMWLTLPGVDLNPVFWSDH